MGSSFFAKFTASIMRNFIKGDKTMENNTVSFVMSEDNFRNVLKIWPTQLGDRVLRVMSITGKCEEFYYNDTTDSYYISWKTPNHGSWGAMIEWYEFRNLFDMTKAVLTMELTE